MNEEVLKMVETPVDNRKSKFPKLVLGLLVIAIIGLGVEGYYFWKKYYSVPGGSGEDIGQDMKVASLSVQSKENPLFYEVVQDDGSKNINIVGSIKMINSGEKSFLIEKEGREMEIFVTEDTRFVSMEGIGEGNMVFNNIGLGSLNEDLIGKEANVNLFRNEKEKIIAESVAVY